MKLRTLLLVALFSIMAIAAQAQSLNACKPIVQTTVNVGTATHPLYCSSESLVQQLTDAVGNGGYDLSIAYTYALNGDSEDAATWINQAITDLAPILSQSSIPPHPAKVEPEK